jgi:hypothetical protein
MIRARLVYKDQQKGPSKHYREEGRFTASKNIWDTIGPIFEAQMWRVAVDLRLSKRREDHSLQNNDGDQEFEAYQLSGRSVGFEVTFHTYVECDDACNRNTSEGG